MLEVPVSFNSPGFVPPQIAPTEMAPVLVDKATPAAVAYLTTGSLEAWDHLMGICFRFAGDLFLLDDFGDYRLAPGEDESCSAWENDERTGELKKHRWRQEGTATRTREWIQEWLLERLHGYHGKSYAEIQNAADRGEFRYLGRQCRNALIDKIRKPDRQNDPQFVRLSQPAFEGGDTTIGDFLGRKSTDGQSSLHHQGIGYDDLIVFIEDNKADLTKDDILVELMAFVEVYFGDGTKGEITEKIARQRGVAARQAREYKRRFLAIAAQKSNPVLRALFDQLQSELAIVFVNRSRETQAIQQSRHEALKDMVDFRRWCRDAGITSKDATQELRCLRIDISYD